MTVSTDKNKIAELLSRSIDTIYPDSKQLEEVLLSGKRLTLYVGIDPTADYVHLGHATNYLLLERFHELGHKIIVLVGDFTAMIGDPSDKSSARVQLTREQVEENLASFKAQIGKILDFEDTENPIEFKFNSEWLQKMSFSDVVELASNFTVQQMIERDTFEKRLKEKKPLYVHEFFYPLMQGYDSVAMDVDLEVGGTDQTFNMLSGRTLLKRYKGKEKFVMTTTLFENPETGEKLMSKSLGTGVALNEDPFSMFAGVMRLPDNSIIQAFIDCTRLPMDEINEHKQKLEGDANPRDIKLDLATEIVKMYHNEKSAEDARSEWISTVSENKLSTNIPKVKIEADKLLASDLITMLDSSMSKSMARQLIDGGGLRLDGEKLTENTEVEIAKVKIVQLGKKRTFEIYQ